MPCYSRSLLQHVNTKLASEKMAQKRPVEEILNESLPDASKDVYVKAWSDFLKYADIGGRKPTESDFLQYFYMLHSPPQNYIASSISRIKLRFGLTYSILQFCSKSHVLFKQETVVQ